MKWGIDDAYFVDRRHGWVVTSDCAAGKGAMYQTQDGGASWRRLSWGFTHNCAAGSEFHLMFLDRQHGWVAAPTPNGNTWSLYRTRDGGRTWTRRVRFEGPMLDEVMFTTRRAGVGVGLAWLCTCPLYRTENAGRTWTAVRDLPKLRYSNPVFFAEHGILMGTGRNRRVAELFRTRDGGAHWTVADQLDLRGLRFPDFRASTPTRWWVYGVRGSTPTALVTTNGGRTWAERVAPGRGPYVDLSTTPTRAWLTTTPANGPGALYSSGDLGRTWLSTRPRPTRLGTRATQRVGRTPN
jgi:photosystem II stability/assembly factor-like uncharacterized protein